MALVLSRKLFEAVKFDIGTKSIIVQVVSANASRGIRLMIKCDDDVEVARIKQNEAGFWFDERSGKIMTETNNIDLLPL